MQLGNILASATHPVVGRRITFQVIGVGSGGSLVKEKAEALLTFVSEAAREDIRRKSRAYLEDKDYKGLPIPADAELDEFQRYFLFAALRDKDDPQQAFCPEPQYGLFRAAVIREQLRWLHGEYDRFVRDEYPELLTEEQLKDLTGQAAGK